MKINRRSNFEEDIKDKYKMSTIDIFKKFSDQGMSYHDVAIELEYSENTIRTWSRKVGIKLEPCCIKHRSEPTISKPIKNALSQSWIKRKPEKE